MKLFNNLTGREIQRGDAVQTIRGEVAIDRGFRPPLTPTDVGRVYLEFSDDTEVIGFNPSYIHATLK